MASAAWYQSLDGGLKVYGRGCDTHCLISTKRWPRRAKNMGAKVYVFCGDTIMFQKIGPNLLNGCAPGGTG